MEYNPSLVSDLKEAIPHRMRKWDAETETWIIGLPYLSTLVEVLKQYYDHDDICIAQNVPELCSLMELLIGGV